MPHTIDNQLKQRSLPSLLARRKEPSWTLYLTVAALNTSCVARVQISVVAVLLEHFGHLVRADGVVHRRAGLDGLLVKPGPLGVVVIVAQR